MSNSYFQFKQFTIHQDKCAMKVSTDACIQGAWTPILSGVKKVLDIGAGTGLLSLMLAQRSEAVHIDAVELDEDATTQAKENIAASPWKERIRVIQGDIRTTALPQYDMIICNPPFFQNSLLGDSEERNKARHTLSLGYEDLFYIIAKVLTEDGYASILLPVAEHAVWEAIVKKNDWNIIHKLVVQPKATALPNRIISICSKTGEHATKEEILTIYEADHSYTQAFQNLLQIFYLKL